MARTASIGHIEGARDSDSLDDDVASAAALSETAAAVSESAAAVSESAAAVSEEERRRASRARVTVRIDYATVDEMFSEFTRDINEGGLFIETDKPHEPGTEVSMQFHLPGAPDILQTVGRVVRVTAGAPGAPAGMGIEFDELTSDDRVKIDQIVRALRADLSG